MATVTWGVIRSEIDDLANAGNFIANKNTRLLKWANRTIREIHSEIDFFYKLSYDGTNLTAYTTSDYQQDVPTDFFKVSSRFTLIRSGDDLIDIIGLDELAAKDPNHDDTTGNSAPDFVAIEAQKVFVYPMFTGTITMESYFTPPTSMTSTGSNPDLPDNDADDITTELIIAGVMRWVYLHTRELDMATYYKEVEFPRLLDLYRIHVGHNQSEQVNVVTDF